MAEHSYTFICFEPLNNSDKVQEKEHNEDCKGQRRQGTVTNIDVTVTARTLFCP